MPLEFAPFSHALVLDVVVVVVAVAVAAAPWLTD